MIENILFIIVLSGQVMVISYFFPGRIIRRINFIFDSYPQSTYPNLYPEPVENYRNGLRIYKRMNIIIMLAGFCLIAYLLFSSRSGEWDRTIVTALFFIQYIPILLVEIKYNQYYKLMRLTAKSTIRRAELNPRRLFDFVSPFSIGLALVVYIAFILFIIYVEQFDFPWFGGYLNVAGITAVNLFFAGIILWNMYGKKKDPYQSYDDRNNQIGHISRQMIFLSIAVTLFISLEIILAGVEMRHIQPLTTSIYFQLLAAISLRTLRIENMNFEVYKEGKAAAI